MHCSSPGNKHLTNLSIQNYNKFTNQLINPLRNFQPPTSYFYFVSLSGSEGPALSRLFLFPTSHPSFSSFFSGGATLHHPPYIVDSSERRRCKFHRTLSSAAETGPSRKLVNLPGFLLQANGRWWSPEWEDWCEGIVGNLYCIYLHTHSIGFSYDYPLAIFISLSCTRWYNAQINSEHLSHGNVSFLLKYICSKISLILFLNPSVKNMRKEIFI